MEGVFTRNKNIANIITVSRIIFGVLLICTQTLTVPFFIIYTYCGFTDMVDGFIARRTNTVSIKGALLDSIADVVIVVIAGVKIVLAVIHDVPRWSFIAIIVIIIVKISAYIVGGFKFHRLLSLHTITNKVTGAVLFLIPYAMKVMGLPVICFVACSVAIIAAIEELVCVICLQEYLPDTKSIFEIK